ncbi:MAG: GNAT family N-acetyltransferase [Lachnospiraceae bacterium]|nr:GNAT family N-acetyltransferase [Lachnospiraceae bacterium]
MITISQFEDKYTQNVIDIVLHFQNDGTRPIVSVDDQPDLLNIVDEYINKGGNFWIAKNGETLIGTIGIMPYSKEIAVLKKFFVYEGYQGKPNHVGKKLYDVLLAFVKENGYKTILLDTPHNTERAHKFYEKAGFREVKEDDLPIKFSHPYKDCDFFLLEL